MNFKIKSLAITIMMVFAVLVAPLSSNGAMLIANQKTTGATIGPELAKALEDTSLTSLEVIITFNGNEAPSLSNVSLLNNIGIVKGITLKSLPMAGVIATPSQIAELANSEQVRSIYLNRQLEADLDQSTQLIGADKVQNDPAFRVQNGGMPVSGNGFGVLVNDTGIDGTHKDLELGKNLVQNVFGGNELAGLDALLPVIYVEDVPSNDQTGGHGTHVAGIVGGTGVMSGGKYTGVAPGADLIGFGSGLTLIGIMSGFDYAITNQSRYNIRVVTNSWGDSAQLGEIPNPNDPINIATKKCTDRGIVVVFSAGNSGRDGKDTITGNFKKVPWVITVANGENNGKLADGSSRGLDNKGGTFTMDGEVFSWEDRPTITAPGTDIIAARAVSPIGALGTPQDIFNQTDHPGTMPFYTTLSGTSMAAPHVAGVVALMLEADPTLSPYEIKEIIENTATNMPGYEPWEVGSGYVNAYNAVDEVLNNKGYGQTLTSKMTFADSAKDTTDENVTSGLEGRLLTVDENGNFNPDNELTRIELAKSLVIGAGIRQALGNKNFTDVTAEDMPFAEAVTTIGGAFKNVEQNHLPVMEATDNTFNPTGTVSKVDLAFSLVQSLALQNEARAEDGKQVTAKWTFQGSTFDVNVTDLENVDSMMYGYVQYALDKGLLEVDFYYENGEILAKFNPESSVTKGQYAKAIKAFYNEYYPEQN